MLLRAGFPGRTTRRRAVAAAPAGLTRVGVSAGVPGSGSITVNFTTGDFASNPIAANDILFIVRMSANAPTVGIVPPAGGWAEVSGSPQGVGTTDAATGVGINVYWKLADGSETTVSLGDSGDINYGIGFAVRGASTSAPINASAGDTHSAASSTRTLPSVTTTVDGCMILFFATHDADASGNRWSGATNANLTDFTEVFDAGTTINSGGIVMITTAMQATAGATGTTSFTVSSTENSAHVVVAVRPA